MKREAAAMKGISALIAAQPEEIRTRRTAAEQAYQGVVNRLGAKGTYENVGGADVGLLGTGQTSEDPSVFKTEKAKSTQATDIDRRFQSDANIADITRLDPKATVANVENSAQFRIASRLTAESEQLLAREGALFDEMERNLQNPIIEGSAAIARENAAELKRAFARGGAARRGAFEAVQKMRLQEEINSKKVQAISQSRFDMDKWARENARTNLEFGQNWASNVGGIRESYNKAMDAASELMTTKALPLMMMAQQEAAALRKEAHQKNRDRAGRWVKGIIGAVMMVRGMQGGTALFSEAVTGAPSGGSGGGGRDAGSGFGGMLGGLLGGVLQQKQGTTVTPETKDEWLINTGSGTQVMGARGAGKVTVTPAPMNPLEPPRSR